MRYIEARQQIQTGDIIGVHGRTPLAFLTKIAQRISGIGSYSSITHAGIAWWVDGRLYSVEMDGAHNVLRPISHHVETSNGIDVFRCKFNIVEKMPIFFDEITSKSINYSFIDLITIGFRLIFMSNPKDRNDVVCSTFVANFLIKCGWKPPGGFPNMPSPGEVCRALGAPIITINERD